MDLNPALGINLRDHDSKDVLTKKLWRITEKIDGVRRLFYKDNKGKVFAYSRSGKADPWLLHITEYLESKNFPKNMIYDTELVDSNLYFSQEDSFILRSKTIGKAAQQYSDNKKDLVAVCFDMFEPEGDSAIGEKRHALLAATFLRTPLNSPIFSVPIYGVLDGNDVETLAYLMDNILAQNKEGLMLMNLDTPYIHGRSNELIKVKRIEDFIGTVIDVEFGAKGTKIEGGVSALICEVQGCTVPVRVGSGFTNDEREYFAVHSPIGELIEIEAFSRTKTNSGMISLSMPIFKRIFERK